MLVTSHKSFGCPSLWSGATMTSVCRHGTLFLPVPAKKTLGTDWHCAVRSLLPLDALMYTVDTAPILARYHTLSIPVTWNSSIIVGTMLSFVMVSSDLAFGVLGVYGRVWIRIRRRAHSGSRI